MGASTVERLTVRKLVERTPMKRLLITVAFLAMAGSAQAQMGRGPNPDLDRDGKVTFAEFKKVQADTMLGRLDSDKDGKRPYQRDVEQGRRQQGWRLVARRAGRGFEAPLRRGRRQP